MSRCWINSVITASYFFTRVSTFTSQSRFYCTSLLSLSLSLCLCPFFSFSFLFAYCVVVSIERRIRDEDETTPDLTRVLWVRKNRECRIWYIFWIYLNNEHLGSRFSASLSRSHHLLLNPTPHLSSHLPLIFPLSLFASFTPSTAATTTLFPAHPVTDLRPPPWTSWSPLLKLWLLTISALESLQSSIIYGHGLL